MTEPKIQKCREVLDRILRCTQQQNVYQFQIGDEIDALQTALKAIDDLSKLRGELDKLELHNQFLSGSCSTHTDNEAKLQAELEGLRHDKQAVEDALEQAGLELHQLKLDYGRVEADREMFQADASHREMENFSLQKIISEKSDKLQLAVEALQAIKKHMEHAAGSGYHLSTVYNIAKQSLDRLEEGEK